MAGSIEKEKNTFYCKKNILITFSCRNVKWKFPVFLKAENIVRVIEGKII